MSSIKKPDKKRIHDITSRAVSIKGKLNRIAGDSLVDAKKITEACEALKGKEICETASNIPVEQLSQFKKGLRISALKNSGINSIFDVFQVGVNGLSQIYGISEDSAYVLYYAAEEIIRTIIENTQLHIDINNKNEHSNAIIYECTKKIEGKEIQEKARKLYSEYQDVLENDLTNAQKIKSFFSWLFASDIEKLSRINSLNKLEKVTNSDLLEKTNILFNEYDELFHDKGLYQRGWDYFNNNSSLYYSIISRYTADVLEENEKRYIPEDLAQQIDSFNLNTDGLHTVLRAYQEFGTKYILKQKNVLLGDEMGLGKTVQAIAAMNHLANEGKKHFMVVCPLGILINWEREIKKFSNLNVITFRGASNYTIDGWVKNGGVAITTYESASRYGLPNNVTIDLLVVDEAHYIKNPNALRTLAVEEAQYHADRTLFMTGTPLENRIGEMAFLIGLLNIEVYYIITQTDHVYIPESFRKAIGPVYLRRVREDVLSELPEKIEVDDWCELNNIEESVYIDTLENHHYMQIRRVSWNVGDPKASSKLTRLKEICHEAKEEGRKVVVFSFFLETIDLIVSNIGDDCYGPITGSVSSIKRQEILDAFNAAPGGCVLVAQINTAGVGINLQTASVVILCEPQWKPSLEEQAISRTYRMGQNNNVTVYRLLAKDTIDERIVQMLHHKRNLFEDYAENSVVSRQSEVIINKNTMAKLIDEELEKHKRYENVNGDSIEADLEKAQKKFKPPKEKEDNSIKPDKVKIIAAEIDVKLHDKDDKNIGAKHNTGDKILLWSNEFCKLKKRYTENSFDGNVTELKALNYDLKWSHISAYAATSGGGLTLKKFLIKEGIIKGQNTPKTRNTDSGDSNNDSMQTNEKNISNYKDYEELIQILAGRYSKSTLPGTLQQIAYNNKDLPITKMNNYTVIKYGTKLQPFIRRLYKMD